MEQITLTHYAGYDELIAPEGFYMTQAAVLADPEREYSLRRSCPPGVSVAEWRTATLDEKAAFEARRQAQQTDEEQRLL